MINIKKLQTKAKTSIHLLELEAKVSNDQLAAFTGIAVDPNLKNANRQQEVMLRKFLLKELGITGLWYNEDGKPCLQNNRFISLSHCFPYIACMQQKNLECGVDIQIITEKARRIERKFVDGSEVKFCKDLTDLIILWSLKEAAFKRFSSYHLFFKEDIRLIKRDGKILKAHIRKEDGWHLHTFEWMKFNQHILVYSLD